MQALKRVLFLMLWALLCAPAIPATSPCPAGFNCSWTYNLSWTPAIPTTVTINWSNTAGGPIVQTATVLITAGGSLNFGITPGTWYVQFTLVAPDGSIAPTMVTYQISYPNVLTLITAPPVTPGAPLNFKVAAI